METHVVPFWRKPRLHSQPRPEGLAWPLGGTSESPCASVPPDVAGNIPSNAAVKSRYLLCICFPSVFELRTKIIVCAGGEPHERNDEKPSRSCCGRPAASHFLRPLLNRAFAMSVSWVP